MALFGKKKKENETKKEAAYTKAADRSALRPAENKAQPVVDRDLSSVLIKPRITEKAVRLSEANVYTFLVRQDATKRDVRDAVRELFNVTPQKVRIVRKAPRRYLSRSRGRYVSERGLKKAYVYVRDGDSIDLV